MKLSIIIPVYNEVQSIEKLYLEIVQSIDTSEYEIIFIDDGSTDGSSEKIVELIQKNQKLKLIQFYRNYGKSAALSEGFKQADGEYVVTMDADLQDDPSEIKNLIIKLEEGYDLVSDGRRIVRIHFQSAFRQNFLILSQDYLQVLKFMILIAE